MTEAVAILERAKADYQLKLKMVDQRLQHEVSKDPAQIAAAEAIQAEYLTGFTVATLAENVQP